MLCTVDVILLVAATVVVLLLVVSGATAILLVVCPKLPPLEGALQDITICNFSTSEGVLATAFEMLLMLAPKMT